MALEDELRLEARPIPDRPWVWQVWDVTHEAACNHFPIATFDSNGAADDYHERHARIFLAALTVSQAIDRKASTSNPQIGNRLTPRQLQVARLITFGLTNKEIALKLGIGSYRVKNIVKEVFERLGISRRAQVARALYFSSEQKEV